MTRPLRVLELRTVRGTGGGPEKTILLGAARHDPAEFDVTVCYIRDRRDDVFDVDRRAGAAGVRYLEIVERRSFDPRIWPALRRTVAERRIDLVHSHDYKTDLLALLLARRDGVTPLATAHGWTGQSWRERRVYYPADRLLLRWFPCVIAVSSEIRDVLVRSGVQAARVRTILNGIDPGAFRRERSREAAARRALGFPPGAIIAGAIGRLERQKRFDLLLDAFAQLSSRHPQLRLAVAGGGSLEAALRAQADRLRLNGSVRLLGARGDIVTLHHGFDLFVQSSEYEGTPNAVLEAMALETPVVATAAGGTAELVRDGIDALVVEPRDVRGLVAAIDEAVRNPDAMRRRAASARARVETTLSFEARTRALEEVYRQHGTASRRRHG